MAGEPFFAAPDPLLAGRRAKTRRGRVFRERLIQAGLISCTSVSILTTAGIVFVLLFDALQFFGEVSFIDFITGTKWTPFFQSKHFGVLALVSATFLIAVLSMAVALPLGLLSAIYLSEICPGTGNQGNQAGAGSAGRDSDGGLRLLCATVRHPRCYRTYPTKSWSSMA